jgi:hypothetical protein
VSFLAQLRRRLQPEPATFDDAWDDVLRTRFAHWSVLDDAELDRMRLLIAAFVAETRWEAANGFDLTEDIEVLIAAQASMLLLGLELDEYPNVTSVIVHPSTMRRTGLRTGQVVSHGATPLAGQAFYRGPVLLSWSAAARGARSPQGGENVVYHEFAHQLDMLDGVVDGTPPLGDVEAAARWTEVCTAAFRRVRRGSSVLRPYAATNPAEFFAVATELFFNRPLDLVEHEPALYAELHAFYGQDPAGSALRQAATS